MRVEDNVVSLSKLARPTSRAAAEKILPKTGSIRRQIMDLVDIHNGLTDFELEEIMNGKHQTISASRRSLVIDGFLVDSGETKTNSVGNQCIVWVINKPTQRELF